MSDRLSPARRRYHVLINSRAGAVLEAGGEALKARLARAFAAVGAEAAMHLGAPDQLGGFLERLTDPEAVPVVVGGDGTVFCLLPALLDCGQPIGILPMGTMNLLGRDLGLTGPLEADVAALHRGEIGAVDIGVVNGVPFHSVSGLGFAVAVASERERARRWFPFSRALATTVAALRALARNRPVLIELEMDGQKERLLADAVLVTVNRFHGSPWRRPRLDEAVLEVHLLATPNLSARTRATLAALTGEWRELKHLRSFSVTQATLRRGRGTRLMLDGEIVRAAGALSYSIRPRALRVLAAGRPHAELAHDRRFSERDRR